MPGCGSWRTGLGCMQQRAKLDCTQMHARMWRMGCVYCPAPVHVGVGRPAPPHLQRTHCMYVNIHMHAVRVLQVVLALAHLYDDASWVPAGSDLIMPARSDLNTPARWFTSMHNDDVLVVCALRRSPTHLTGC
eukprot:142387-Chlamydomonas_euryale.AAC.1